MNSLYKIASIITIFGSLFSGSASGTEGFPDKPLPRNIQELGEVLSKNNFISLQNIAISEDSDSADKFYAAWTIINNAPVGADIELEGKELSLEKVLGAVRALTEEDFNRWMLLIEGKDCYQSDIIDIFRHHFDGAEGRPMAELTLDKAIKLLENEIENAPIASINFHECGENLFLVCFYIGKDHSLQSIAMLSEKTFVRPIRNSETNTLPTSRDAD